MATTPTYAFRYPASTDLPDGPTQLGNLALDIENTLIAKYKPLYVAKSADESLTSNATLQADDHLTIASIPIGTYQLFGEIWATGDPAGDIKVRFNHPAGTFSWSGSSLHETWTNASGSRDGEVRGFISSTSPTTSCNFGMVSTSQATPIQLQGRLASSGIGTLSLDWAQATSNATATIVKAGSWMCLRPVA